MPAPHATPDSAAVHDSAADNGCTGLVLDTARVVFCDSGFLAVLDRWPGQGRRLRLVNRSRPVQRLLNAAASTRRQSSRVCAPPRADAPGSLAETDYLVAGLTEIYVGRSRH
ncbi:hypothetical protein ABZT27_01585 [Streptomyces sp. NPDC005389]|uniref:STAS domain-containing protein n=1 Tax=Streptomyces sp. NPDC005389 TaxID=3157040 RepID=UPI0033A64F64